MKKDVGIGLRFGAGRSPKGIFRLDYACALDPDPRGKKGCLISLSGSQAF